MKRVLAVTAWAASCAALSACAGYGGTMISQFDARDAEFSRAKGPTGTIEGEAFLRRDYGFLVAAAGERVFLIPATRYSLERFGRLFGGDLRAYFGNAVEDPPAAYYSFRRETKADRRGRFAFEKVPPGRYIVATRVFWTEPDSFFLKGGAIYDIVDVKKDEVATAIVSGK